MKILFLCVANSARSQLAEGLARQVFGDKAEVASAGSAPGKLSSHAVQVMAEIGIDISHHYSKRWEDLSPDFRANLDLVITLCAEEVCPILQSPAEKLHWPLPDPAAANDEDKLPRFREVRDSLRKRLGELRSRFAQ